jgi:phenylalanyl-tRNA synthetase beta chain
MKASVEWIRELLPRLEASPELLAERLTAVGIEVEGVSHEAAALAGVVVAEVRALRAHPNADKLRLATVFDGEVEREVVCGAPNVEVGQRVALAGLGAKLAGGIIIEPREIRGVKSEGMICSSAELGLAEGAAAEAGILVLPSRARPGSALSTALGRTDALLEISPPPTRPDVLSHFGLAREYAAIFGLQLPERSVKVKESAPAAKTRAAITVEDRERCPRYTARVIIDVKVGPSPEWVVRRLETVGLRSISNVVDATNLVLLEFGHPIHAFDLDKLNGAELFVRTAKPGEVLTTLDALQRKLDPDDLVIADRGGPVALAGVMGGLPTGVADGTTAILLESALFDPRSVRRTSKRHALHTEASHRFERGADPDAVGAAADRAASLIAELAGGTVLKGRIDVSERSRPTAKVAIRPERATLLLGRKVEKREIKRVLEALGLSLAKETKRARPKKGAKRGKEGLLFTPPSWRVDLHREEDLIEEVARLSGYDAIPTVMPPTAPRVLSGSPPVDQLGAIRREMVGQGFLENVALAFSSKAQLEALSFDVARAVRLENPLGEETAFMRMSLLPALLRAAKVNQAHQRTDLRLFEIGNTFRWGSPPGELPEETGRVAVLMRGRRWPRSWGHGAELVDAFDLKGAVEGLLEGLRAEASWVALDVPWLHPRSATDIRAGERSLGVMGELHPDTLAAFELEGPPVYVAELSIEALVAARGAPAVMKPLPRYPGSARDLSFFIDRSVPAERILTSVRHSGASHLVNAEVFDVYEGKGLPEGKRSIAVTMSFRSDDRTLTDQEIESGQRAVERALEGIGAQIRRA